MVRTPTQTASDSKRLECHSARVTTQLAWCLAHCEWLVHRVACPSCGLWLWLVACGCLAFVNQQVDWARKGDATCRNREATSHEPKATSNSSKQTTDDDQTAKRLPSVRPPKVTKSVNKRTKVKSRRMPTQNHKSQNSNSNSNSKLQSSKFEN